MIHQYQNNGYNIVMDVNSGSVHVVEPVVYDAIASAAEQIRELEKPETLSDQVKEKVFSDLKGKYSSQEIGEALEDIQETATWPAATALRRKASTTAAGL